MADPVHEPSVAPNLGEPRTGETLRQFTQSFDYGARNDLLFKFIKRLPNADAAEFLRGLLEKLGQTEAVSLGSRTR